MDLQRCRQILNLKPGASKEDIQKSYHDLVKVWHPDRFGHDPALALRAQEMLKEINEAHRVLMKAPHPEPVHNTKPATHYPATRPIRKRGMFHDSFIWFLVLTLGSLALFGIARSTFHGLFYKPNLGRSLQEIA